MINQAKIQFSCVRSETETGLNALAFNSNESLG